MAETTLLKSDMGLGESVCWSGEPPMAEASAWTIRLSWVGTTAA